MNKLRSDGAGFYLNWCPGCKEYHGINTIAGNGGGPVWAFDGNTYCPTFSPSILVFTHNADGSRKTRCHYFIRSGKIEFCSDSGHQLAGQTVDMTDEPEKWRDENLKEK